METPVDVLVVSASRPHLLWMTLHSFQKHVKGAKLRFFIDDDPVDEKLSKLITRENMNTNAPGRPLDIAKIVIRDKTVGPFRKYLDFADTCSTPYFILLEDDWLLNRDVDFGRLVDVMNTHFEINQLIFHHLGRGVFHPLGKGENNIIDVEGFEISLARSPRASPAVWRTSCLKTAALNPDVRKHLGRNFRMLRITLLFPDYYEKRADLECKDQSAWTHYLTSEVKSYYLHGTPTYVRHTGFTWTRFTYRKSDAEVNLFKDVLCTAIYMNESFTIPWTLIPLQRDDARITEALKKLKLSCQKIREKDPKKLLAYVERARHYINTIADTERENFQTELDLLHKEASNVEGCYHVQFVRPNIPQCLLPPHF